MLFQFQFKYNFTIQIHDPYFNFSCSISQWVEVCLLDVPFRVYSLNLPYKVQNLDISVLKKMDIMSLNQ